jgi:anti-sigma regulatory factor (Ser/Thr protein kinase)
MAGQGVRRDNAPRDAEDGDPGDPGEPGDPALSTTITLPGVERSVAIGRRFVRDTLGTRHPALETVALSVSELATNAIMHTPSGDGGHLTIGIVATGHVVRTEVTNDGTMATKPCVRRDAEAENGRGILIIEALADSWGVVEHSGTTTVWVEFRDGSWALPGGHEPREG